MNIRDSIPAWMVYLVYNALALSGIQRPLTLHPPISAGISAEIIGRCTRQTVGTSHGLETPSHFWDSVHVANSRDTNLSSASRCEQVTVPHASAGCTFANFDGVYVATFKDSDVTTHVTFTDCSFTDNTIYPTRSYMSTPNSHGALIAASAWEESIKVRLEACTFTDNTHKASAPLLLADERGDRADDALFYSDSSSISVCKYEGEFTYSDIPPCAATSDPLALSEAGDGFLTSASEWLAEVQQVRCFTHQAYLCCSQSQGVKNYSPRQQVGHLTF